MVCSGFESSLLYCEHNIIGTNNCKHREDVSVICSDIGMLNTRGSLSHCEYISPDPSYNETICSSELDDQLWTKMRYAQNN